MDFSYLECEMKHIIVCLLLEEKCFDYYLHLIEWKLYNTVLLEMPFCEYLSVSL